MEAKRINGQRRTNLIFKFAVEGVPRAKGRPRVGERSTRTPEATKEYEGRIRAAIIDAKRNHGLSDMWSFDGPVAVDVTFDKNLTLVYVWEMDREPEWSEGRPDLDNILKALMDGLQPVQSRGAESKIPILLADDRQVVAIAAEFNGDGSKGSSN